MAEPFYTFLPDGITFRSSAAFGSRLIYAPLCGVDGLSLKSAITPFLSGDIKLDRGSYLTKPASREDLRAPARHFFVNVAGQGCFSFYREPSPGDTVTMGPLWHEVRRKMGGLGLECAAMTLVPVDGSQIEVTRFTVRNVSDAPVTFSPTAAFPIFGRALANKHDHEHVTALLKRTSQLPEGVLVEPTMLFNEEGHRAANCVYFVFGCGADGTLPAGTFPTVESFYGDGGSASHPESVLRSWAPRLLSEAERQGKEAMGALRFADTTLPPRGEAVFIVAIGIADDSAGARAAFRTVASGALFEEALRQNHELWTARSSSVTFRTGDADFGPWMRWVTLQPVFRRIFGCSFLPDHDYGKGGKGWRDIWQDLLSLILLDPGGVRDDLLNNFGGVRVDGSNATIIGQRPGEFIADRNAITRVWMDHGVWPFVTTLLYINQSGDADFLFERAPYFMDPQWSRSLEKNAAWTPADGNRLKDARGNVVRSTVLEHILLQHLVQFFNVGEHNITRLESADWNDGLDMAFLRGESVTFSAFYAGNLLAIADLVEQVARRTGRRTVALIREILRLLDTVPGGTPVDYDDPAAKKSRLFQDYFPAVQPWPSGDSVEVAVADLAADLRRKGEWVFRHIRRQELVSDGGFSWFNGYYDNEGRRLEGRTNGHVRMTLTGQVFPLMSGLASREETAAVVRAVDNFLLDPVLGGYRLNTDFGLRTYLAMGRAFGFAFGTKENGAVFSHMAVMYGYALYRQGFAREGYRVLRSLYEMSRAPDRARIYPGIPEYFDGEGRGMYHFLTGAASWYTFAVLTMAFGARGEQGDLLLLPQLVREEFDAAGEAQACFTFAGRRISLLYCNAGFRDAGAYRVVRVSADGADVAAAPCGHGVRLARALFTADTSPLALTVTLS